MIKKSTIDQVFDAARVEEVIGDFVQLKKSGSNFKGLSPFTDERTPSFMVSPVKQIWKDFSSGKGGNVVAFLMEHEHFNYPEAIRYLAKKYGIEIEETQQTDEEKAQADERESLFLINEFARDYFERMLHETQLGKSIGLSYFKERGFTQDTIKKFHLGYSPDVWDAFTQEAIQKGYKLELLEKTGLSIVKENKQFDRFKGRVMFPIHSMSGRTLGFGGRILRTDKKAAKYLNSPESPVYHKSQVLYGLHYAKQSMAKEDRCYLVEGYTDVIQLHQAGIENVVSSSGTALTEQQIRLILRLTKNITVLFDGDEAGMRAALRGIDLILAQGLNVKVCTFPEGEDPDSFARKHPTEDIKAFLNNNAQDFISFKASLLMKESANDPIQKAATIRDMVESIAKIPDRIQQEIYLQECSRIMDISENVLYSSLAQLTASQTRKAKQQPQQAPAPLGGMQVVKEQAQQTKVNRQHELEKHIIHLLLHYGGAEGEFKETYLEEDEDGEEFLKTEQVSRKVYEKIYLDLQEDEIEFTHPVFKAIYQKLIDTLNQTTSLDIAAFIRELEPAHAQLVSSLVMNQEKNLLSRWEDQNIFVRDIQELEPLEVEQTILHLRNLLVQKKVQELMQEVLQDRANHHANILEDINDYNGLKKMIADKLNRVI
jgi:DNA primase